MNIAMLIALNRAPELHIHIRAAIHNGLTEETICEACRHAMIYCGVPAGRDALAIASDVIHKMKDENQYPETSVRQSL
jgi:4-carboxymuconolactone decarboxylase